MPGASSSIAATAPWLNHYDKRSKTHGERSKHTRVIIETDNRGSKRTTVYEEIYEEEW